MLADVWVYCTELFNNWAGYIWTAELVLSIVAFALYRSQMLAVYDWLDQALPENVRVPILRGALLITFVVAGFLAWEGRYRGMVNEWRPQITERDKTIARLQAENKRAVAQWQDNANQQSKQFDEKIKGCRKSYDALLWQVIDVNSKSGPLLDQMTQFRRQFQQAQKEAPVTVPTYVAAFRSAATKFQERLPDNPCN
jgi:hypothetical protein